MSIHRRKFWALLALLPFGLLPAAVSTPAHAAGVPVTKVLVFIEENHSLNEMAAQMPYTYSLATRYGYATNYHAITHPSLPNYLAIAAGSTFGVADDSPPSSHPLNATTVFGAARAVGRTAKTYAESMPSNCYRGDSGNYAVKHNPWAYFTPAWEKAGCQSFDVPESQLATDVAKGTLPTNGLVVPNLCDDAHNCSLATADAWFKSRMTAILAGPDFKSGHLAVVLTADEDDYTQGNTVLTVMIHPSQNHHVIHTYLNHYTLTRFYQDVAHSKPFLGNAGRVEDLGYAFGVPIG